MIRLLCLVWENFFECRVSAGFGGKELEDQVTGVIVTLVGLDIQR